MKKNTKVWLGHPQSAQVLFPSDFKNEVLAELKELLSNSLMADKFDSKVNSAGGIYLENMSFRQLMELAYRVKVARDIRINIAEVKLRKSSDLIRLLEDSIWHSLVPKGANISLAVQARQSHFSHEGRLKQDLQNHLTTSGHQIVAKAKADVRAQLYVNQDRARLSLSLAGVPLYQRGYKSSLVASASMREDLAQCLCQKLLGFLGTTVDQQVLDGAAVPGFLGAERLSVQVPFAGSGTLGFEMLMALHQMSTHLWQRTYSFATWGVTPPDTIDFLKRKLKDSLPAKPQVSVNFWEKDHAQYLGLVDNTNSFLKPLSNSLLQCHAHQEDVMVPAFWKRFADDIPLFLINPPYGSRLEQISDVVRMYDELWRELSQLVRSSGLIICPNKNIYEQGRLRMGEGFKIEGQRFLHGGTARWALLWKPQRN